MEWVSLSDKDVLQIFRERSSFYTGESSFDEDISSTESLDEESSTFNDSVTSLVDLFKQTTLSPPTEPGQFMVINESEVKIHDTNTQRH